MAELEALREAILNGNAPSAAAITKEALNGGTDPLELVMKHMVPAMEEVGRRFECGEFFVPEMLLSARAMQKSLELVRPLLAAKGVEPVGRVAIGTVKGDLHDIGKNLVGSLLEGGGFEVHDLGSDVPPQKFVQTVKERKIDIVCLSALLTVTMTSMKTTIECLQQAGLRDRVKILIGGAPVTPQYARQIGADAYGENASVAVKVARDLVGVRS